MTREKVDNFEDVVENWNGIFGNSIAQHDHVGSELHREGIEFSFQCGGCKLHMGLLIEWPEFVAMKYGLDPAAAFRNRRGMTSGDVMSWVFSKQEQRWRPNPHTERCPNCNFTRPIRLTHDEPERQLKRGRRAGHINPAAEQQVSALCDSIRKQARGG